jgi:DNA polymerase V
MKTPIAISDSANFYVSAERLFEPSLKNTPVIVLSNNDGCAVARSDEAKALGIKMGAPFHKLKDVISKHGVRMFSSNYTLYAILADEWLRCIKTLAQRLRSTQLTNASWT